MGNFSNQQKAKEEAKENEKVSRETLGKYFYDLAKVSFTAMVVGGAVAWISDSNRSDSITLLLLGTITTIALTYTGYKIINSSFAS